jgi:hypothetical protein
MKSAIGLIVAALVVGACVTPVASSPTATVSPFAAVAPSPTAAPSPTTVRGSALVPPIASRAQYGDIGITLDIPDRTGQPAEGLVWHVDPFKPESGYAAKVATALGLTGPGTVGLVPGGASPGTNGPWRLWFGLKVLAVNEGSGEVYYFDPSATDGPQPPGAARRDPTEFLRLLLASFGWTADVSTSPGGITRFIGTEVTARADPVISGSWLAPGYRETAILFPRYANPADPGIGGPHIYDSDHVALLTAKGRPAEIIHRPIGAITSGEIYRITTFRAARAELLAAPQRYLRFLSNPTGEAITLGFGDAYLGHVWAGAGTGLTHAGQTLVPVWVFSASGTASSGVPVDALFVVDAVLPELRAQGLGGTANISADLLLRLQIETLGGQNKELLTARGAARYFLGTTCEPAMATQDADTASGTLTCAGSTVSFTVKRAFPGLGSIWYLAESNK